MSARAYLETYLEGWRLGDGNKSLSVTSPGFYYDDPNTGRIFKKGFVAFMEAFKADAAALKGGKLGEPFLTYTHIVVQDETSQPSLAWCWWHATDTELQGSALIHFDDTGVLSERIAYFSKLP